MFFDKPNLHRYRSILGFIAGVLMLGCQPLNPATDATTASPESSVTVATTPGQRLPITAQASIHNQVVELEVAQTRQQQATGLMSRPSLADNRGMLFLFNPPQIVSFWMKHVLIDLDMIFLREGEVIAIQHRAHPCKTTPCPIYGPKGEMIDQVIELRGGRAKELGIQAGDRISIQPLSPES
ncbi:DUF192 domain-containing protein [Acaryochloris sp. IP29b_bin.137]|uniref:DUF192 domain-containing protein n=1 Tax=Acaryochloris sp. IP29b_bin.137 TaxID=2969217 RepID=UPI002620EBA4|nr:DUF192 domain-containing protein [Acaryochloris sp. IP29b_bin.137]